MARANTFEMDKGGYSWDKRGCAICSAIPEYRGFYYPTFMNGDAEWLGDFCKVHKDTKLSDVMAGKVVLKYEVGENKLQN